MKKTFACDESMIITIPIGSLRHAREAQLMPEKFQCVYRDFYKIFVIRGKPKPLGAAQAIAGVVLVTLGVIFQKETIELIMSFPSVVFVVSGMLSFAAGRSPNMHVTKLSFSLNIVSLFWAFVAICFYGIWIHIWTYQYPPSFLPELHVGIIGLIVTLLIVETLIALFLIYWLSKAVCREQFNTLPIVLLKQAD